MCWVHFIKVTNVLVKHTMCMYGISGDRIYENLRRFGLLSVDDLPSEISGTDVNVCFMMNYLRLENGAIGIMVEDFPYSQAIDLSTFEKGNGFLMIICGFTVALYYIMIVISYVTPIVETNMAKWL